MDEQNNIGCYGKDGSFVPKHRYDTVFGKQVRTGAQAGAGCYALPGLSKCHHLHCWNVDLILVMPMCAQRLRCLLFLMGQWKKGR